MRRQCPLGKNFLNFSDYRIYNKESMKKAVLEIFKNIFFTEHLRTTASENS